METVLHLTALVAELIVTKGNYGDFFEIHRRRQPMSIASELAWQLLPPLTFGSDRVVISGALAPAYDLGGDSFDYGVDSDTARIAVFDAMGHGLEAGMLATVAVAAYRNSRRRRLKLDETAAAVDEAIRLRFGSERFVTAVLADLDLATGTFCWIRAGHPAPLLLRGSKVVKTLSGNGGLPLGLGSPGEEAEESLEPGDQIVFFTDGVTEARSPDGDLLRRRPAGRSGQPGVGRRQPAAGDAAPPGALDPRPPGRRPPGRRHRRPGGVGRSGQGVARALRPAAGPFRRKACAPAGRRRAPWRMAAVPSPLSSYSLRLAEPGDFDAYMDAFDAVAAEGRWMGAEAPIDRDARRAGFDRAVAGDDSVLFLALADADGSIVGSIYASLSGGVVDLGMFVVGGSPRRRHRFRPARSGDRLGPARSTPTRSAWPSGRPTTRPSASTPATASGSRAPAAATTAAATGRCGTPPGMGLVLDDDTPGGPGPSKPERPDRRARRRDPRPGGQRYRAAALAPGRRPGAGGGDRRPRDPPDPRPHPAPLHAGRRRGVHRRHPGRAHRRHDARAGHRRRRRPRRFGRPPPRRVRRDDGRDRLLGGGRRAGPGRRLDRRPAVVRLRVRDLGLRRVELNAAVDNPASRRVAEKAGFELEGVRRAWRSVGGVPTDFAVYAEPPTPPEPRRGDRRRARRGEPVVARRPDGAPVRRASGDRFAAWMKARTCVPHLAVVGVLDRGDDVDGEGADGGDRPSDVAGVEAAGQDARRHAGVDHGAGQAPVDRLAGAGRAAGDDGVDQHGVGAGVDEAAGGGGQDLGRRPGDRGVDAQRLDEADAAAGQAGGQCGDAVLGLVAVELEGVGLGGLDELEDRAGVAADDGHPGDERRHQAA